MRVLHVLISYLAVTALPFHPFAFASPLAAIDYDGYVDSTTQNHRVDDSTLMKRVPDDIMLEARQVALVVVPIVIIGIVVEVALIVSQFSDDNTVRGNDVNSL